MKKVTKPVEAVEFIEEQEQPTANLPKHWHRPHIQRLRVSLDTSFLVGSVTDGLTGSV